MVFGATVSREGGLSEKLGYLEKMRTASGESIHQFQADIDAVQSIAIVPTILNVVCQITGMGFAAVARVTEDRWIVCSVKDEINFGLKPGGELELKTTICDEIRQSRNGVIIDEVRTDAAFCNHHTPRQYGFQSYISIPIILRSGEFFGTLCAIDPAPAQLKNDKIIGMFSAFAELIAFHLESLEIMRQSRSALRHLGEQIDATNDDTRQLNYSSNHDLQEPLRKMRLFSTMLVDTIDENDVKRSKDLALKLNTYSTKLSSMVNGLAAFTELTAVDKFFSPVDLNRTLGSVLSELGPLITARNAIVEVDTFPVVEGIEAQLHTLCYHLIDNAIKFSKPQRPLEIQIKGTETLLSNGMKALEIRFIDNGRGMEPSELQKIFDLFRRTGESEEGVGMGLAFCRKIIRNHGGTISALSDFHRGATIIVTLPLKHRRN